jgi:hypothetical protein
MRGVDARAERREIGALLVYFFLVVALSDIFNVRLGVELLTAAVLIPAVAITRMPLQFIRDWWFLLAGLVMWNLSGPIAAGSPFPAHLDVMLNLDRALFFGHDPVRLVQLHLRTAGVGWLDVSTSVAYNMHLAEPYIAGYFLWRLRRDLYLQFAASALTLLVVGFIAFIVFPAVPPWMAAERLVYVHGTYYSTGGADLAALKRLGFAHPFTFIARHGAIYLPGVQNRFGIVLRSHPLPFHGTPLFYVFHFRGDAIAAMPSEHAAFPVLELLAFARLGRRYAIGFSCWVLAVLFSVVYLGEHWVTDVLAGWLLAVAVVAFVRWYVSRAAFPAHRPPSTGSSSRGYRQSKKRATPSSAP